MRDADVLIVGGGIAGLACAWHVGRRGVARTVLVERERAPGLGSSGRSAAILKQVGGDPVGAALTRRSAAVLHRPPPDLATAPLVRRSGLVLYASDDAGAARLERLGAEAAAEGVDVRRPRGADPALALLRREPVHALLFPDDGRIDVAGLIGGLAAGARGHGVDVRTGVAVERLLAEDGRVAGVLLADGSTVRARTTVLAAGGWAGRLGRSVGSRLALRPTRRHLVVGAPDATVDPDGPILWKHGDTFYCRPEEEGLLLCACDESEVDPDRLAADPAEQHRIRTAGAEELGRVTATAAFWCGLRTFTADGRFAVGPDPDVGGLFWVAGLGGSGMGAGLEAGRIAAARLAGDEPDELGRALDPGRLLPTPVRS